MRDFSVHPRLRVAALATFAAGAAARGAAYIQAPETALTTFVDRLVPLHVWAIVWIATGVLILAGIWHRVLARWALSAGASLWGVWAVSYLLATATGESSRGWVTGATMATLAAAMWIVAAATDSIGPPPPPAVPDSPLPARQE